SSENQHPHARVGARVTEPVIQLFNRLSVQSVQHLRPIESNRRDAVFFVVQNIFVAHRFLCFTGTSLTTTSSPLDFRDPSNHKSRDRTFCRSSPQAPCALAKAVPRNAAPGIRRT